MDWLDLLAVQGTLKSLLQHHSSKAPILCSSAFFMVQLSHPYMTTGKTTALTRWTYVGKVTLQRRQMLRLFQKAVELLQFQDTGRASPHPVLDWLLGMGAGDLYTEI